jgi:hypothetical protein
MSPGKQDRRASLSHYQASQLLSGNLIRETTLPSFVDADKTPQSFGWVLKALWSPIETTGVFAGVGDGDGAPVKMLDTAVIDAGKIHSYLTTAVGGAKNGYLTRRDPKKTSWEWLGKEFVGGEIAGGRIVPPASLSLLTQSPPSDFNEFQSTASFSALPVAIVHKAVGTQELLDSSGLRAMCQGGVTPDIVAIQRFIPPRGVDLMNDENLQARNTDTVVGNYFHEFTLSDNVQPQYKCWKYGAGKGVEGFAKR